MSDNLEFNIELDLRPNGPHQKFNSTEKFQKWLDQEIEFWNWSESLRSKDGTAHQKLNGYLSKLNNLKGIFQNLKSVPPAQFINQMAQLQNELAEYYRKIALIHSSDPRAKFIKSLSDKDPVFAAYILNYFVERRVDRIEVNIGSFEGACAALLFKWGVNGREKGESEALEELRRTWQDNLKVSKENLSAQSEQMQKIVLDTEEKKENQHHRFDELLNKLNWSSDDLIAKTKKKFEEIEKLFQEKLALHSAISYWETKGKSHSRGAIGFAIGVFSTFLVVGVLLFISVKEVVGNETIQTVQLWKLSLLFLIATIGIWSLRIMIRLLLSNVHLGDDAKERRTMLLTYLALLKEGELPEGQVRHLILQALFRPSSTGVVRDDAVPPFMAEWLKRTTGAD